ncbi:MAG: hypothetical protein KC466_20115 [Myxococcales bacterium]|nr:hypothetical protein [Myxococcales bacterium]
MEYTRERATEFWYEFDRGLAHTADKEVRGKVGAMGGRDHFLNLWRRHRSAGTLATGFVEDARASAGPIRAVSAMQLDVFDKHFGGDRDFERRAFEDFGQGVLFDDRRSKGHKVPMMRIYEEWGRTPIEYFRWHCFARAAQAAGVEPDRWLHLDRAITLAWKIQTEARPEPDNAHNPGLPEPRRAELRARYMAMSAEELDEVWAAYPWPEDLSDAPAGV